MAKGIRTGDHRGFNKSRSSKFREGSRVRQTPEEGRWTYQPKRCGNDYKDEDNSLKTLNDEKFIFSVVDLERACSQSLFSQPRVWAPTSSHRRVSYPTYPFPLFYPVSTLLMFFF